jgi:Mismatch repair ATPase (MutS family)
MTFKVGDKVKFLNDVGGGIITKIKQQTAFIETSDGFEIPAQFSELIKVEDSGFGGLKPEIPAPKPQTPKPAHVAPVASITHEEIEQLNKDMAEDETDEEVITSENCTLNILLSIEPVKQKGHKEPVFQVYLISDCAYNMLYTFSIVKDNFVRGRKVGHVEEETGYLVAEFTISELREIQSFKINCIFYKKGIYLPHEPVIYEYKVDPLFITNPANWTDSEYCMGKAIVVNITEMSLLYEIERMVTETEEKFIIQKKRREQTPAKPVIKQQKPSSSSDGDTEEIDLHIEELVDNFSDLSSGEIVDIQMSRFNIALEGAIRGKTRKIVFIHGVGNGKLKYEIRKTLDSKYPKLKYQDASFKEYGYGATMVLLK